MQFVFTDSTSFEQFKESIKEKAKKCEKSPSITPELLLKVATDALNNKAFEDSYFYLRCAVEVTSENFPLERLQKVIIDEELLDKRLQSPLQEKFYQLKNIFLEKKRKEKKMADEKNVCAAILATQGKNATKLRNAVQLPLSKVSPVPELAPLQTSSSSVSVIHPIRIDYEPRYSSWTMKNHSSKDSSSRRGLVNLGNTCYLNSVLQSLSVTRLASFFLGSGWNLSLSKDIPNVRLTNAFAKVIQKLNESDENDSGAVSPVLLKTCLGEVYKPFAGLSQQDANELLNVLLEGVHNGLNKRKGSTPNVEIDNSTGSDEELARTFLENYVANNASEIVNLFMFQERSSVMCPHCHQTYRSFSPCTGIEVPIPKNQRVCVEDCLAAYCHEDILDEKSYSCGKCKKSVKASQQLTFYSCPEILVITLKRFQHSFDLATKISTEVIFQQDLTLHPFMCNKRSHQTHYRLVGIVNHSGSTSGGHYTADIVGKNGIWVHCSDESTSDAVEPDFSLAYILFFQKVTPNQL